MLIPVILSGGAGTRLWPVSRETHPKPFMRLSDGQSLLQKTWHRVSQLSDITEILTVTNRDYYFKTKDEYASVHGHSTAVNRFLLEPMGRNTAAAIAMAAFYAMHKYGPEGVLLILPADHLIDDQEKFAATVTCAYELAQKNQLVTFGIKPTVPETGFGYIKLDQPWENVAYTVAEFVEKPTFEMAQHYLASGHYVWNSGLFCFRAEEILAQLAMLATPIFEAAQVCWKQSQQSMLQLTDAVEIDSHSFQLVPDLSIDYAVMEKAKDVIVIPCEFPWNDIGSWSAVSELVPSDAMGNRVMGETMLVNVSDSFIQSESRLVAALDVKDLIIIDTPDALLVANRHTVQDVKKIVTQLKQNHHDSYKIHRTVTRPWGTYTVLEEGERFKMKRIVVKPGASLSLQMHHHRSEHWVVVSGVAKVTNGTDIFTLSTNESTFIPAGHQHRLENPGLVDLILIEVQTGEYLGEDDIVRFEDKYGRTAEKLGTT